MGIKKKKSHITPNHRGINWLLSTLMIDEYREFKNWSPSSQQQNGSVCKDTAQLTRSINIII